jgi:hypothetical protein
VTAPPPGVGPGFAYPPGYAIGHGGYPYPFGGVVPRPPRPAVVTIAIIAIVVGVVVSGLKALGDLVLTVGYRTEMAQEIMRRQAVDELPSDAPMDMQGFFRAYLVALAVGWAVAWLLAAVAATVCAAFAGRGSQGARVTLAVLAGVFALAMPCNFFFSPLPLLLGDPVPGSGPRSWFVVSVLLAAVLFVLAWLVLILLLVPPANRFYRPGPGNRFASQIR